MHSRFLSMCCERNISSSCFNCLVLFIQQSAERCVSTLLDLIQTKVNYVVQEAIVVIRDIFRKYPNKYGSIAGLLETFVC